MFDQRTIPDTKEQEELPGYSVTNPLSLDEIDTLSRDQEERIRAKAAHELWQRETKQREQEQNANIAKTTPATTARVGLKETPGNFPVKYHSLPAKLDHADFHPHLLSYVDTENYSIALSGYYRNHRHFIIVNKNTGKWQQQPYAEELIREDYEYDCHIGPRQLPIKMPNDRIAYVIRSNINEFQVLILNLTTMKCRKIATISCTYNEFPCLSFWTNGKEEYLSVLYKVDRNYCVDLYNLTTGACHCYKGKGFFAPSIYELQILNSKQLAMKTDLDWWELYDMVYDNNSTEMGLNFRHKLFTTFRPNNRSHRCAFFQNQVGKIFLLRPSGYDRTDLLQFANETFEQVAIYLPFSVDRSPASYCVDSQVNGIFFRHENRIMYFCRWSDQVKGILQVNHNDFALTAAPNGTLALIFSNGRIDVFDQDAAKAADEYQKWRRRRGGVMCANLLPLAAQLSLVICALISDYAADELQPVDKEPIDLPPSLSANLAIRFLSMNHRLLTEMQDSFFGRSKQAAAQTRENLHRVARVLDEPAHVSYQAACNAAEKEYPGIFATSIFVENDLARLKKELVGSDPKSDNVSRWFRGR